MTAEIQDYIAVWPKMHVGTVAQFHNCYRGAAVQSFKAWAMSRKLPWQCRADSVPPNPSGPAAIVRVQRIEDAPPRRFPIPKTQAEAISQGIAEEWIAIGAKESREWIAAGKPAVPLNFELTQGEDVPFRVRDVGSRRKPRTVDLRTVLQDPAIRAELAELRERASKYGWERMRLGDVLIVPMDFAAIQPALVRACGQRKLLHKFEVQRVDPPNPPDHRIWNRVQRIG